MAKSTPRVSRSDGEPLITAFTGDAQFAGTAMIPCVGSTVGAQPTIVPSSVANDAHHRHARDGHGGFLRAKN